MLKLSPVYNDALFSQEKGSLYVKEDLLDIYSPQPFEIPDWKPSRQIGHLTDLKIWIFDIETEGLDPNIHKIKMIGNLLNNNKILILDWLEYTEIEMLQTFFHYLEQLKPDILTGHNIWKFDLPFILRRCEILGIKHPFYGGNEKIFRTAMEFGRSVIFNQYHLKYGYHKVNIIDTLLQARSKDYVERKLNSFSLKSIPVEWGLREKDDRTELTYKEMLQCYSDNNISLMTKYLTDDLIDTKLIFDRIFPEIFYQKLFLDWSYQSLATSGNGSKWNSILSEFYQEEFIPQSKLWFEGGYTWGQPGLFEWIEKLDVESLYPSIQLRYCIHSSKDFNFNQLKVLNYLKKERVRLKKLPDKSSQDMSGALKIFINSSYGFLGVAGLSFNDMRAGALVTAYGRLIVKKMVDSITSCGGKCIEVDTDGVLYQLKGHSGDIIHKVTQSSMPEGINIDREFLGESHAAKLLFVPPKSKEKKDETEEQGMKKNYIIIGKKTIAKGRYAKRNSCKLEREFQVKFLELYSKNPRDAFNYYKSLILKIQTGSLDYNDIIVRRKVSSNEKKIYELNLVDSDGNTEFYYVPLLVVMKKKTKFISEKGNKGHYCIKYYTELIEKQYNEIKQYI